MRISCNSWGGDVARDLTKGSIIRNLMYMSLPTMIGFSSQMVYDIVDIFWIGRISSEAIAGVTIFSTLFWTVEVLNSIIGQSSISLISQSYGRKDLNATNRSIEQTITFKCLVAIIAAILVALFLKPALRFFSDDQLVINAALDYGYIRLFFLPIMFSSYSVNTALRCVGNARTPMMIMILASIINITLDPVLIFDTVPLIGLPGAGLGVFGAAVATITSQTIAFLIGFTVLFSGKQGISPRIRGLFRLHWPTDKKLLTVGLPTGIEGLLRNLSGVIVLRFVAVFGTAAVAATGVAGRLFGFAFMPLVGLSMGGSTIVGQSLGVNEIERARKTAQLSGILGAFFLFFFVAVAFLVGPHVMGLFSDDPEIIALGTTFLRIGSVGLIFLAYGFGLSTVFSGSGFNLPFMYASVVARWAVQIPVLVITITWLKMDIVWVWWSYFLSDFSEFVVMLFYYKKGTWRFKRVG